MLTVVPSALCRVPGAGDGDSGWMDVDVDVGDLAHLGLPQGGDGQRGVIVETETRGRGWWPSRDAGWYRSLIARSTSRSAIARAPATDPRRSAPRRRCHAGARRRAGIRSRCPAHEVDGAQGVDQTRGRGVGRIRRADLETVGDADGR